MSVAIAIVTMITPKKFGKLGSLSFSYILSVTNLGKLGAG